jgi:uncharacterized membrane protein YdjX (TVP38/TMEM64 family)
MDHPLFTKVRSGFQRHALGYMLFLRLSPGLSFPLVNVTPALLGVPLSAFVTGTLIGFVPSRIALSTAGAGLGNAIDAQNTLYSQCLARHGAVGHHCPYDISLASLLTPGMVAAFLALAVLALVPAILDAAPHLRRRFWSDPHVDD